MSRGVLRAGLLVMGAFQLLLGLWTVFLPESFYNDFPTVDWTPPYSAHLFRDFGGASLGLGVVIAAAAVWLERRLVFVSLTAYLAFSIPHLFFHAHHLDGDSPVLSAMLLTSTVLAVLLPAGLLLVARRALPAGR